MPVFYREFSGRIESTSKKPAPAVGSVGIFVGIAKLNARGEISLFPNYGIEQ
jgi:hypothetical protein